MAAKKSNRINIENKRGTFLLMGLVVVLGLVFIVFEWGKKDVSVVKIQLPDVLGNDIVEIPHTAEPPKPPRPLPKMTNPDLIKIVETMNPEILKPEPPENYRAAGSGEGDTAEVSTGNYGGLIDLGGDTIIDVPDIMPEFKGNLAKWLTKNLKYPIHARDMGVQGKVICQFVVNKDGTISDIVVVRSAHSSLDKEAQRVIGAMPQWRPGIQSGKPVKVRFTLPVQFTLQQY